MTKKINTQSAQTGEYADPKMFMESKLPEVRKLIQEKYILFKI